MNKIDDLRRRREDLQGEIRRVREHPDYNDSARARRIAPLYRAFKGEERRVLEEMRAGTAEAAAKKGRQAFAPPAMPGADKALLQMNYRHALDSVEGIADHKALAARLDRAILTGDEALARAVAYRANEAGDAATVSKYLDADEAGRKAYEEWAQAHEQLQKLEQLGPDLAFGYAPMDEPPEMRHPEAKAENDAA